MLALLQALPTEAFDEREARVKDIRPGLESSVPENGVALRPGLFLFPANDGIHGAELWATDGTTDGTMMLKDINPGPDSGFQDGYGEFSEPVTFDVFTVGGLVTRTLVFFTADDGATGTELWATDGSTNATGTFLVADIRTVPGVPTHDPLGSSFPHYLTVLNNQLVFGANDGVKGIELWCHDPANNLTFMLKDIFPGDDFSHSLPTWLTVVGTNVFFAASDYRTVGGGGTGNELWKTDGTIEGTVLAADLRPGPGSGSPDSSGPRWLANLNGTLMFVAHNGVGVDNQLWRYDDAGASLVRVLGELNSPPEQLKVVGGTLFFAATDHLLTGGPFPAHGQELWRSDGTGSGTFMVKDINPIDEDGIAIGSAPRHLVDVNGRLFFVADDGSTGRELWTSDGTPGGTFRVEDILPGSDSSDPTFLTACGRLLYFAANNGTDGVELWRVPPGTTTAVLATNINPGAVSAWPRPLGFGGRHLLFAADDGSSGTELWSVEYTTYLATSTADAGAGSLRHAILDANAFTNPPGCIDRICIDMAGPGPHTLQLQTQLPAITDPVTICDPLYDPSVDARFLADGDLLGLDASGLIILTKDTEVIGIGWTRFKTGVKLAQGGANIHLRGLLFLQISDVGIEADLAASGLYQFQGNRFRGGMNFGTKVNISGHVEIEVRYLNNVHTNNQVAIQATEQLSGSVKWIVTDNIAKNGGTGARFFIKVAGSKDFANNRWEGHVLAGLTYVCSISDGVTVIIKSDGDLAAGNGLEGLRGEVGGSGEVRFRVIRLGSSDNGSNGIGVYAQAGARAILEGRELDVQRNGGMGLFLQGGSATLKAGYHIEGSLFKDNHLDGQWLVDVELGFSMLNNRIRNNGGNGVVLAGSSSGGISGNTISGNTGAGVFIQGAANASLTANTITGNGTGVAMTGTGAGTVLAGNAIYANTGLAFDLGNDGPTANDDGDGDPGPNNFQNYPLLTSVTETAIVGTLNSAPNSSHTLRFFANANCHPSGYGEGESFLGSTDVITDGAGNASFTFVTTNLIAPGEVISATATDPANNTSEFSPCFIVSAPPGPPLVITTVDSGRLELAWPDTPAGFGPEFATDLVPPVTWLPVTEPVVQRNGLFIVTVSPTNDAGYYRLRRR